MTERYACMPGWHPIIDRFVAFGRQYAGFRFYSARDRGGFLRLSWAAYGRPEALEAAEETAVQESMMTCRVCGAAATVDHFCEVS